MDNSNSYLNPYRPYLPNQFFLLFLTFVISIGVVACQKEDAQEEDQSITDRMAEEHKNDEPVANESSGQPSHPVETEEVAYGEVSGNELTGYYAQPKDMEAENLPGLIVIHEWWGLNDNIRMMTRRLAGEGYQALAVDLYNGEKASDPSKARELMQKAMDNEEAGITNLKEAHSFLAKEKRANTTGVIGWCFGGGWTLKAALSMPDKIDAANIYYGRLVTDAEKLDKIDMPILGIFGEEDEGIPPEKVRRFETVLDSLGKDASIHIYEAADHAFANPSGNSYNEEAAQDAWKKTVAFFERHMK